MNDQTKKTKSKKGSDRPGWLNLDRYDFFCSLYIGWFFLSLVVLFQGSIHLDKAFNITANHERLLFVYASFVILAFMSQSILGLKGISVSALRLYALPGYITYYTSSFVNQLRKTVGRLKSNLPLRFSFYGVIPILYMSGAFSTNETVLVWTFVILASHMLLFLAWGVRWSLNPFDFLKHANFLKDTKVKSKFALNLVKFDKKDKEVTYAGLLKKIDMLKKWVTAYEAVVSRLSSNRTLFACFLSVLLLVSTHIVIGGAVLLRAYHLLSLPVGIIKMNNFFSGSLLDFFYISLNTFLPNELYGVEIISKNVRWILTLVTFSSYALLVVAIAGFSMAGSSKVEETVSDFTKDMHGVIEEAVEILANADENKLLPSSEGKKRQSPKEVPAETIPVIRNQEDVHQSPSAN